MTFNPLLLRPLCFLGLSFIISATSIASSSIDAERKHDLEAAANIEYQAIYEHQTIRLKDGKWSGAPFVKGGASRPSVGLIRNFTFTGDLDGDGSDERVVFLWESSGGSGTWVYMAVLAYVDGKPVNLATYSLGDRVQLQMGRVAQGKIELDVIQSEEGDAACCPTHKILRTWSFRNNQLTEHKPQFLGIISPADFEGVEWKLSHLNWRETIPDNIQITIKFHAGKISGSSGCNHYFAAIKAGEMPDNIAIGQVGSTRMACSRDVMKLESRFLHALSKVNKYSFVNGQLALGWQDKDAVSTMLFTAQKP